MWVQMAIPIIGDYSSFSLEQKVQEDVQGCEKAWNRDGLSNNLGTASQRLT